MQRKNPAFDVLNLDTADELWVNLSPTNYLRKERKFIYRGQADSNWDLIPSILRFKGQTPPREEIESDLMVFLEHQYLRNFARHCDTIGIRIPGDSQEFRREVLSSTALGPDYIDPALWPDIRIRDLMAMAQHHGVPTRLLDWTSKAFTAAYFAASSALELQEYWNPDMRIAIWAFDISYAAISENVLLHYSPGSTSPHLAAQGGLFTVHPHLGVRGELFEIKSLEHYLADSKNIVLTKITMPVSQTPELLSLCITAGFSGAHIYPSADGAGRAVIDGLNVDRALGRRLL